MFYFKACPKCHGDVYQEKDLYGTFNKCLQCGRIVDLKIWEPGSDEVLAERTAKVAA